MTGFSAAYYSAICGSASRGRADRRRLRLAARRAHRVARPQPTRPGNRAHAGYLGLAYFLFRLILAADQPAQHRRLRARADPAAVENSGVGPVLFNSSHWVYIAILAVP